MTGSPCLCISAEAGKDYGQEVKGATEDEMLKGITNAVDMSLSRLWEVVKDREAGVLQSMGWQRVGHDLVTEEQRRTLFHP